MRPLFLTLLASTALTACGGGDEPPAASEVTVEETEPGAQNQNSVEAETARLDEWFAARFEEQLDFSPITKTTLGRKDEDYDQIDDMSEAAEDRQLAWYRSTVEELEEEFDRDMLTPEAKTSYDLWVYDLEQQEKSLPYRRKAYTFTQMQGPQAFLPNFLINFHAVETDEDMQAYVTRIGGVAKAIGQLQERAQAGLDEGTRPPRFAYDGVIAQSRALITGAPFEGEGEAPLWSDAKAKIAALEEAGTIDAERAETLREETRTALLEEFGPAYEDLIAFIEEDMPNTTELAEGVGSLPDGKNYYEVALQTSTTTDMTPDEVHELGLSEVARIRGEMEAIKDEVGFEGTLQEFFEFMRTDDQFFYPNTDEGREEYLKSAREHLAFIEERLPDFFGILPKAGLTVKRVEAFREEDGGAQHYYPGTPDGSRDGIFYAHLSDMRAMPIPQLEVIAYHEGVPGHHMQISIAQELEGVPEFRTQNFYGSYVEGWALYSEILAKEMGAYDDAYSDFGRLTTEIWRAIRLVLDTGLHSKGWSEEEAVQYFMDNSPAAEGQIRSEVRRYLVWPGQATTYKIGMLKIQELRARAEEALGDDFDVRAFHDTVLGGGALPLDILERRVDEWIADQQAA
ncbi:DUF885 domain-containing protein [Parvularcula dongshanensis]|uniref:Uncharacterized protein (DUF885 family) n=1 Tax=Parvularcula dongshanensis TaxID=1173995 RepID=A0A840I317_9PROT|nr:DUF885 domain-containing protein [Parvularcula dongshanensis]MBB4658725.1 uncharacterized protein (DUF885 family) [Parvularcula dongshanensis]